jgi:hypothetical protein
VNSVSNADGKYSHTDTGGLVLLPGFNVSLCASSLVDTGKHCVCKLP